MSPWWSSQRWLPWSRSRPWLQVRRPRRRAVRTLRSRRSQTSPISPVSPRSRARPTRRDRLPEVEVTVSGTVAKQTTPDGKTEYTLTTGSATLVLDAGPAWFHGDKHPLDGYVGKSVTVVGDQREGSTEVDVRSVDGTVIREPGKPPWAGGWKRVGERHPGWTQEKWDRWQAKRAEHAKRHGVDCWPRGQCKEKPAKSAAPTS